MQWKDFVNSIPEREHSWLEGGGERMENRSSLPWPALKTWLAWLGGLCALNLGAEMFVAAGELEPRAGMDRRGRPSGRRGMGFCRSPHCLARFAPVG